MIKRYYPLPYALVGALCLILCLISCNKYPKINCLHTTTNLVFNDPPFTSCHASTIVETTSGDILTACFAGSGEGNPNVSIWLARLSNDSWGEPVKVADGMIDGVKTACWNPVLFQIPGGDLLLFYKVAPKIPNWDGYVIRSKDNGHSWSEPEKLPEGHLGPIRSKPIIVDNKLICGSSTEFGKWKVHFEMTDLDLTPESWTKTDDLSAPSDLEIIQPTIIAHPDGSLQAMFRSKDIAGKIPYAISKDNGSTWGDINFLNLPNNNSGSDAIALRDGGFLFVYNHANGHSPGTSSRSPINVDFSDDGINWKPYLLLEKAFIQEFSYPAIIQDSKGLVHIVYTWKRKNIKYTSFDPNIINP